MRTEGFYHLGAFFDAQSVLCQVDWLQLSGTFAAYVGNESPKVPYEFQLPQGRKRWQGKFLDQNTGFFFYDIVGVGEGNRLQRLLVQFQQKPQYDGLKLGRLGEVRKFELGQRMKGWGLFETTFDSWQLFQTLRRSAIVYLQWNNVKFWILLEHSQAPLKVRRMSFQMKAPVL